MSNYDFLILSAFEFEHLTRDLLQKHLGCYIESFTSGRDGGIDLRSAKIKDDTAIIQCKRYSKYSTLKSELSKEVTKVKALAPSRYFLSTSVGLTPVNKKEIMTLFAPYIKNQEDIYGKDDLNNLLALYPDIEKQYYKLWLCSTEIMDKIIHRKILNWSKLEYNTCIEESKKYVMNESFDQAMDMLNKYHYVIISGIPGIGKTTLARQLIFQKLGNDYEEFVCITNDLDNAMELLEEGKKQIFFFDDFLGNTFFDQGEKGFESKLLMFVQYIKKSKDKLLIMTTREYILQDAKLYYEKFETNRLDLSKCVVDLGSYTNVIKAEILYNHLSYSAIDPGCLANLVDGDYKYLSLIEHKNFNPRLIEAFINHEEWKYNSTKDFYHLFLDVFDHPFSVWEKAFDKLDFISQYALAVLLTMHSPCDLGDWREAYLAFADGTKDTYNLSKDDKYWIQSLKTLDGSFIKTYKRGDVYLVDFFNPSIHDFLVDHISTRSELTEKLLSNAVFIEQLYEQFTSIFEKNKIHIDEKLIDVIAERFLENVDPLSKKELKSCIFDYDHNFNFKRATFDYFKCLNTLFRNIPSLKVSKKFDANFLVLSEEDFKNTNSSIDDRLKVLELVGDDIGYLDTTLAYHQMSNDITSIEDYITYLEYGQKHKIEYESFLDEEYIDNVKEQICWEIDHCSLDDEVYEIQDNISKLSSMLPNQEFFDVMNYAENQAAILRESGSSDSEPYEKSEYYIKRKQDRVTICEMFGSLVQ